MSPQKRKHQITRLSRPVAIAALVASGILQPLLPVLAAGTNAGTSISNTATATYTDDNPLNIFSATSNTVQIVVAPVSGITIKDTGITNSNVGAVQQGDQLKYNFTVTNIGNTAEDVYIPGVSNVITSKFTATKVEVSTDGGTTYKDITTYTNGIVPGILADGTILVRVTGNVNDPGGIAGDAISVTLGNTLPNDNSAATQNVVNTSTTDLSKVRTNFTIGVGTPANNKEASAFQSIAFNTSATNQAFSLLKKTVTSVPGPTAAGNDDILSYSLNFSVLNTSPSGNYTPAALVGTNVKVNGTTSPQILVSDAIPAGTVLNAAPVAPSGWQTVYSTDTVGTTIAVVSSSPTALTAASWTTATPATPAALSAVTRVGFIYIAGTSISPAAPAVTFPISVTTSGLPVNGGKVDNIAQVFGQTLGDTANTVVMDQSGDNNAADFNSATLVPAPVAFDPAQDTGKANPLAQGVDPGNNTAPGPKGADTEITITGTVAPPTGSLLNGPNGQSGAVGPTNSNDDFTNASTKVPAGQAPTALITSVQSASFTNSVKNNSAVTLAEVTVQPVAPSQATAANGDTYGADSTIPVGTLVTLTNPVNSQTATYLYGVTAGVGSFVLQNPYNVTTNPTGSKPIDFGNLATGSAAQNYTVTVTLPINSVIPLTAVSIPMIAFPATAPGAGYAGTEASTNVTIDRVYTGYMQLTKQARILSADGTTVVQDWASSTTTQILPGQFIEYRIVYQNISSVANGSGNVILNANNFTLTEDGTTLPNNWAATTTHQQNTVATLGILTFKNSATPTPATIGTTDPANGTDVGVYQDVVTQVAPNAQGTFQFRRLVK
jgi:hypothetical protein